VLQGCPVGLESLKIPPIERVVVSKQDIHGDQRIEVIVVGVGQTWRVTVMVLESNGHGVTE
jgi:hypothetical protein